ncbi:E3 ubiquitin-protein ligase NEURL3-like [Pholidichthys leucotaenia]
MGWDLFDELGFTLEIDGQMVSGPGLVRTGFEDMGAAEDHILESEMLHRCGPFCLGPLTFDPEAKGQKVCLSQGSRLAERTSSTFNNGIVFSSRPVIVLERVRLRVLKDVSIWQGAVRVGFTTVSPSARSLPLPSMAMPNLTDTPGHWAAPMDPSLCEAGTELEFWVSNGGTIYAKTGDRLFKLLNGVDLSQPLWAMIDIYGQTCSVLLLGSEKRGLLSTRKSCPAPEPLTLSYIQNHFSSVITDSHLSMEIPAGKSCIVCMGRNAEVTLPCGHECLCQYCVGRVCREFGSCPLCRQIISAGGGEG